MYEICHISSSQKWFCTSFRCVQLSIYPFKCKCYAILKLKYRGDFLHLFFILVFFILLQAAACTVHSTSIVRIDDEK